MSATWPWAVIVLAAGFVGGLAVGRALWCDDDDVDIPTQFHYRPQPTTPPPTQLRVVPGRLVPAQVDQVADELAAAIRRHPAGKRIVP